MFPVKSAAEGWYDFWMKTDKRTERQKTGALGESIAETFLKRKGYNNISEYIRDLLRRDLHLEEHDRYPYDVAFLKEIANESIRDRAGKKLRKLTSKKQLLA